jgi:hypothetical protein
MQTKPRGIRHVVLNVYGGESLHHPNIVEILQAVRDQYQLYKDSWELTVTTTTNAVVSEKKLKQIIPMIDEFTISYHTEATSKQKNQLRENILTIKKSQQRQKCVIMMSADSELFEDAQQMIKWCSDNQIKYLPKQLDHATNTPEFNYTQQQVIWFDQLYSQKSYQAQQQIPESVINQGNSIDLADTGRGCCGGRQLCKNNNYKTREFFVDNKFPDWYCSVNHFFLFVKQVNEEIYVNKDCKMNFSGTTGPIGNLSQAQIILDSLEQQLINNTLPIIQCKKYNCFCGLCAPKAKHLDNYKSIMKKYQKV